MENESGVTRSIIDHCHSSGIQGDQTEAEGGASRSIINEIHSSGIQRYQI